MMLQNADIETQTRPRKTVYRKHTLVRVVVLLVAFLALAPAAEAFIIDWMPIFGVVNGVDVARLNVALADIPSGPCSVSLAFFNGDGIMVGDPNEFTLQGSRACSSISSGIRASASAVGCDCGLE